MKARVLLPIGMLLILGTIVMLPGVRRSEADTPPVAHVPTRLAVCPTFLAVALQLDAQSYTVLPTASTAQSLALLADGSVDAVLAGRALKPQEPAFAHALLGEGYAFVAKQEKTIREADLQTEGFVTDLDPATLQAAFGIRDIRCVDNVYDALNDRIAITDFDGTDYARAAPVHVLHADGSRVVLSRTPVLYCAEKCPLEIQSSLRTLVSLSPGQHAK